MQPRAFSARKRLTRRSSSEWNEITASRPPVASTSQASGRRLVDLCELVVDGDAQRLEGALGRVAAGELRRDRHGALDHVDELLRGRQLGAGACAGDRAGDLAGVALLAVIAQQARDPALFPGVDDLCGGQLL